MSVTRVRSIAAGPRFRVGLALAALLAASARAAPQGARVQTLYTTSTPLSTITLAPDGRLFLNEKGIAGSGSASIRIVRPDGTIAARPFATLPVDPGGALGLLGLAFDPSFAANGFVYVYYTYPSPRVNRISRFRDADGVGVEEKVLWESPSVVYTGHVGGRLEFGPDGMLYVIIGDNNVPATSQDLASPWGKVLRVRPEDGSAPPDNPFTDTARYPGAEPRVWAWGFQNGYGLAFANGLLYETENGPSCDDELNLVERGGNYGAGPGYACYPSQPTQNNFLNPPVPYTMPLAYLTASAQPPYSVTVPTGIQRHPGVMFPEYEGRLIYGRWLGAGVWSITLSADGRAVTSQEAVVTAATPVGTGDPAIGRVIDVRCAPDGAIYFIDQPASTLYALRRIVRAFPDAVDAVRALALAAGAKTAGAGDLATLDVAPAGAPDRAITVADAVGILRKASGLDP